jgi:DUF2946 family protein
MGCGGVEVVIGWTRVPDGNIRKRRSGNVLKLLAFSLCVFTVFFVVLSTSHIHPNGQDDGACQLCQAAHLGISTALAAQDLPVPLIERASVHSFVPFLHSERFLPNSSPRAPPSA